MKNVPGPAKKGAVIALLLGLLFSSGNTFSGLLGVTLSTIQHLPGGYYPLITDNGLLDRKLDKELNLTIKTSYLTYLFGDAMIHSMTDRGPNDRGQFRLVGLKLKTGVTLAPGVSIYYQHFSQHLLDHKLPAGRFPLQDAIGVDIILYTADKPQKGLFQ